MRYLLLLGIAFFLYANPTTLMDEETGFYKNDSGKMLPFYENITCKDEEVINQIPIDAQCIIALERYKNGKALLEYKGQKGWVNAKKNPDAIILMRLDEVHIPMSLACSQVGNYFFEVKSVTKGRALKVYEKPSSKSKVVHYLVDTQSCLINLGCEWPWCRIDFGDGIGWVLSRNLTDRIQHVDGYCYPRERNSLLFLEPSTNTSKENIAY